MVEHCIALFKKEQEEKILINYVTTGIQFITENVAVIGKNFGGSGKYLAVAFEEIINPPQQDCRTPEEIVEDVLDKCKF